MNYTLHKLSSPGFRKDFNSLEELTTELQSWICGECLEDGKELNTMLGSSCGCEFRFDDPIENPETLLEATERYLKGDHRICLHK